MTSTDQLISQDTQKQLEDLMSQFFASTSMTPDAAQKRFAGIIGSAD
jgi:glucose/mannose transport system substrate-binding protein